jgi:hypothetical protein
LYYGAFIVDYSAIHYIKERIVHLRKNVVGVEGSSEDIEGNIVLIGDEKKSGEDRFNILGDAQTYGGVLAHACSIVTLREGPLRHLSSSSADLADYGLLLFTLALVVVIHIAVSRSERRAKRLDRKLTKFGGDKSKLKLGEWLIYIVGTRDSDRLEVLVSIGMAILLTLAFTLFIDQTQVFWPEHLYIAGCMFLGAVLAAPLWPVIASCFKAAGKFLDEITSAQVQ